MVGNSLPSGSWMMRWPRMRKSSSLRRKFQLWKTSGIWLRESSRDTTASPVQLAVKYLVESQSRLLETDPLTTRSQWTILPVVDLGGDMKPRKPRASKVEVYWQKKKK